MSYIDDAKRKFDALKDKKDVIILSIESSCDETACAVVKNGREVLSNVVASQIEIHKLSTAELCQKLHREIIFWQYRSATKRH